ncbi:uncharacterized protein METZ01_LOCUS387352, partial [marine metagenome]
LAWLTLFPNIGFFPVTSHMRLKIYSSIIYIIYFYLLKRPANLQDYGFLTNGKVINACKQKTPLMGGG